MIINWHMVTVYYKSYLNAFVELRAEINLLATKVQDIETGYNTSMDAQQQFEFVCAKFNQKLKSSQAVVEETITPEQGLNVMQSQMASLEVLECSCY